MVTPADPVLLVGDVVALGDGQARAYSSDGRHVELAHVTDTTLAALDMLDGRRSWASLLGCGTASGELFTTLASHGMLVRSEDGPRHRVRLYGCGPLGWRVASDLVRGGSTHLTLVDATAGPAPDVGLTAAQALAERLRAVRGARVSVDEHWPVGGAAVDLAIVASTTVEIDRAVIADLGRNGVAALVVCAHQTSAVVGPLLRPGARACLHCLDLARSEADPAWPVVVGALCSRPARPRPVVVGWAAGVACALVEAIWAGADTALEATTWRWETRRPGPWVTSWPAHPSCGCRFGQAA